MLEGGQRQAPPLYPPAREREIVPIVLEVGCVQGPVRTGKDSLHPTAIRSADSPACRGRYSGCTIPDNFPKSRR
jgi:hypothetical protein